MITGKLDPVCEEFHDEFMMSRWREPTVMLTRTSVLQDPYPQGPHNERARGGAPRGRCESGARLQWRQGLPRTKAEETPLVPRSGIGREVPADHEAQGQKCSDDCRSRVRSCRRATNNSQEEIGVMNQKPSKAEQAHGARSQGRRERRWSGSPWKQGLTTP